MTMNDLKRGARLIPLVAPILLTAGCVWKSDYDALQSQNTQLKQQVSSLQTQVASDKEQIGRLQGTIKYVLDSDLLFQSGGYKVSAAGQQTIGQIASKLAASQTGKVIVTGYTDNAPVGPALAAEGITSNAVLSQKRAEAVMAVAISQGVKPELIEAHGMGDASPIAPNTTAAGRAKNRRVEVSLAPTS